MEEEHGVLVQTARDAAASLKACGFACLELDDFAEGAFGCMFDVGIGALDALKARGVSLDEHPCAVGNFLGNSDTETGAMAKSALDVSGIHARGAISRYNAHREGFIFSNGVMYNPLDKDHELHGSFVEAMQAALNCALFAGNLVLDEIASDLASEDSFDERYGPLRTNVQWHLKRYDATDSCSSSSDRILLGVHTDPSLVSVVIVDTKGPQMGAAGLQCYTETKRWREVANSGRGVAIILSGSILEKVTKQAYKACRHRVVAPIVGFARPRVAATFFLRPAPNARLAPIISSGSNRKESSYQTFRQWKERVSNRYQKRPKKESKKR